MQRSVAITKPTTHDARDQGSRGYDVWAHLSDSGGGKSLSVQVPTSGLAGLCPTQRRYRYPRLHGSTISAFADDQALACLRLVFTNRV